MHHYTEAPLSHYYLSGPWRGRCGGRERLLSALADLFSGLGGVEAALDRSQSIGGCLQFPMPSNLRQDNL